jgi:hypothetical protein
MRLILFFLSLAFSAVCFAGDTILGDFSQTSIPFSYGSWVDPATGKSILVSGPEGVSTTSGEATAKGGACTRGLSISASDSDIIELEITVLAGNEAKAVNVLLENANGTQAGWRFDLADIKPGSTKKMVSSTLSEPLFVNSKAETANSKTEAFDPKAIVSWHVQGDYSNDNKIRVRFDNLVIRAQK